jgi:hypothetical protein
MGNAPKEAKEVELESDAWQRFVRAVDIVAKSPPQHRTKADRVSEDGAPSAKAKRIKADR